MYSTGQPSCRTATPRGVSDTRHIFCPSQGVPPPPPSSPRFPGSQLVTVEWGETLTGWVGAETWELCYSSFTTDATTPRLFHQSCDGYSTTLTVAHIAGGTYRGESVKGCDAPPCVNHGNRTFGAYAVGSWSLEACCKSLGNECHRTDGYCHDRSASADFLFGLWPGPPARFLPKNTTGYQTVASSYWPVWGDGRSYGNDLDMGGTGVLGADSYCNQGSSYDGSLNKICGGVQNWGQTEMEVWRIATPRGPRG